MTARFRTSDPDDPFDEPSDFDYDTSAAVGGRPVLPAVSHPDEKRDADRALARYEAQIFGEA